MDTRAGGATVLALARRATPIILDTNTGIDDEKAMEGEIWFGLS